MKKRILIAVLAVVCIIVAIVLIDPGATKPWTWANRLSAEDVEKAVLWGFYPPDEYTLTPEETEELVTQLNRLNRLHFQENKRLEGGTPWCGINLWVDGTRYSIQYCGLHEISYGEPQWWIRSNRFNKYMESLWEAYDISES